MVGVLLHLAPVHVLPVVLQSGLGHQLLLAEGTVKLQGRELDLLAVEGGDLLGGGVDPGPVILQGGDSLQVEITEITET